MRFEDSKLNPKPNSEVNNWQRPNACANWKRDLVIAYQGRTITADHGSTGGGSCLQADQSILLWGFAWQVFIKRCNETLLEMKPYLSLLLCVLRYWIRSMTDIKESLNAVSGPKTLFGGQDSALKSRIWVCALQIYNKRESSLANRGHRTLRTERRWLPYCYRVLLKIRGSSSYAEGYEVQVRSSEHLSRYLLDMGSRSKCNLTMVLSLTV